MNYITACPICETQFLLTDDNIKACRGKVRCGSCKKVFNVKNRVTKAPKNIATPKDFRNFLNNKDEVNRQKIPIKDKTNVKLEQKAQSPITGKRSAAKEPEFLQKATAKKRSSTWPIIFSLLLIISAALQGTYYMRDKLAAYYPQLKPALTQACAHLKCKVGLPKDLKLITISDADMQEDERYASVINLTSTITNAARYAQAYPNIKLTLTNSKEKPVIKKLITPSQYLKKGQDIDQGIAARETFRMKLALHISNASVSGYRVDLMYN